MAGKQAKLLTGADLRRALNLVRAIDIRNATGSSSS